MSITYNVIDGIAHIVIDNGKVNALTPQMHKQFFHILKAFEIDENARVGVLYGAGGRSFSAGDDIKNKYRPPRTKQQELEAALFLHQNEGDEAGRPGWEEDVYHHRRYKPIVAAVNGYCLGAGMIYLMLHTDIRVAASTAKFGVPEINFGAAGISGVTRMARNLPYASAAWIALIGGILDAEEARRVHLINEVVDETQLMARAEELARLIMRHPPTALRVEMEALEIGRELDRDMATRMSVNLYRLHRWNYEGYGSAEGFFGKDKSE